MSNNFSHIMDKRSPKSPVLYERYKSGCAWSLMRFCDFRQDDPDRKLISNRKGLNTHVADDRFTKNRFDLLSNFEEKGQYIDDGLARKTLTTNSNKPDITKIKEEEMAAEKQIKNKITNSRAEHVISDSQPTCHVPKNRRRKASKGFHGCKDIATLGSYESSADASSKKSNTAALNEASCNRTNPKKGRDSSCRSISPQKCDQIGENDLQVRMNEAAEAFINQNFIKGRYPERDRTNHQSKHFSDALEILNSNKDLFIKLLQDPNSLLVKHIQDLRDSQAKKEETKSFSDAKVSENCSIGSVDPENSDTIVVLKPDLTSMQNSQLEMSESSSPRSLYSLRNRAQSDKPAYFSFEHMKRKLKHAIGLRRKEKISMSTGSTLHKSSRDIQSSGDGGKGKNLEVEESNSSSKVNLGIDRTMKSSQDVKRIDKTCKAKEEESGIKRSGSGHDDSKLSMVRLKQREAYTDVESRKRLSEILRKSNENYSRRQDEKTSGKTILLPEYDFLSTFSPGRHWEHGFNSAQMRFSPYSNNQMVNEKKQRLRKELENKYLSSVRQTVVEAPSWTDYKKFTDQLQTLDAKPIIPRNHFSDIQIHESVCSVYDTSSPRGSMKIVETHNATSSREINYVGVSSKANGMRNTSSNQSATANTCGENRNLKYSKLDLLAESCTSPASKDTDGTKDKGEHPSPVSVLEEFLDEDITSPPSTRLEPDETATEPKQISCASPEDLKINLSNVMDEHEPLSKYVRELLQVSGINWDELSMKYYSSPEQLLESSLFDQVEALSDQSCADDPKLLFDYVNEVLLEVYHCHFSCSPRSSLVKPKLQPILSLKDVHYEVMKCVNWDFLSQQRPCLTLQQLVEKDLAKSGTWMDILGIDTERAISELVDSVLEKLTLETAIDLSIICRGALLK